MTAEFAQALRAAQKEFPPIGKGRTARIETKNGGSYSYKYADLGDVLDGVLGVLHSHGLVVTQATVSEEGRVGVETRIYHDSGHVETFGPLYLAPMGSDPQSAGSAITYARRYALTAALGIATEDDDDGRAASQPRPEREAPPQDGATWLANSVQMFAKWSADERRETVTQIMREQGVTNPLTLEDARAVFEKAKAIYYESVPVSEDEAPF